MSTLNNLINNGSFCVLPFIHQEKKFNGTYHVCCYGDQLQSTNVDANSIESFNSENMFRIRSEMISGKKPSACNYCYKQEDKGIYSPRMRENESWARWTVTHSAIEKSLSDFSNKELMRPISYDLRYSNTCTLKCRMCNSSSSSTINAEYQKLNSKWPEKFWTIGNHRINHEIELHKDIQKIYLAGGEPLVEPLNLELLENVAKHNPNLTILINTSLNNLSDKFLQVLNKFKYLTLVISIDGIYEVNDYIRHGSNFNKILENIEKISHHDIMFSTCVSIYNIFSLANLLKFIHKEFPTHAFNHGISLVNDIEELLLDNLPYEFRPKIINELSQVLSMVKDFPASGIKNVINVLEQENFDKDKFTKFIRYTKILDENRNESVAKIVPELSPFFNE